MYKYTHFIPQNIAPKGSKQIGVYDSKGNKVCAIPLGRMTPPSGEPLYTFALVSDPHIDAYEDNANSWKPRTKLDNALTYFEEMKCAFCVLCGDLTQTGFYRRTTESDESTTYYDEGQLKAYHDICKKHPNLPVYEIAGNHETYFRIPLSNDITKWGEYTGKDVLHYAVEYQNDVFIFCGHPLSGTPMTDEAFTFLSDTLSVNRNKRCFVFVHPFWNDDSGDVNGLYANHSSGGGASLSLWSRGNELKNLLRQFPNAVLFHGHTHIKFEEQAKDKSLNYTHKNGFHSVHIPSLGRPRDIIDNALVYAPADSQGYLVDVYDDCIVLNGMDLINNKPVPLGTLKIDTTGTITT